MLSEDQALTDEQTATVLKQGEQVGVWDQDELWLYRGRMYVIEYSGAYRFNSDDIRHWQPA